MGHGGTSFGFEAGANTGTNAFYVEPTSYDYDGLISEAGDLTPKYEARWITFEFGGLFAGLCLVWSVSCRYILPILSSSAGN